MRIDLSKLSSAELKDLDNAVTAERKRRGKRSPEKHLAPTWVIPKHATVSERQVAQTAAVQ